MAAEPYTVIRAAMEKAGQIAVGRVVMSQRERLVALEPREKGIIATVLRSHDEVRKLKDFFDEIPNVKPDAEMVAIATKIIEQKEADFDPTEFNDRYEDALRDLIEEKKKGHKIVKPEEPEKETNVINLMDALKASLGKGAAGKAKAAPKKAANANKAAPAKKRAKR
jgi:DNA end-binding protein Ku